MIDTFYTIDELVDSINIWDPTGDWTVDVNTFRIVGGDQANTYGTMVVSQHGTNSMAMAMPNLQIVPRSLGVELDTGYHVIIVTHIGTGCMDTLEVDITCNPVVNPPGGTIDTVNHTVLVGFDGELCFNLTDLDTLYNDCEDASGMFVDFVINDTTGCIEYNGMDIGCDTACIISCDTDGICDTTILVVCVYPPSPDTIFTTIEVAMDTTFCLDTTELAGTVVTINNFCDDNTPDPASYVIDTSTWCITFTGEFVDLDQYCFEICDDLGNCDTTIFFINVIEGDSIVPPIAIDDDTTTMMNTAIVITSLDNDKVNGELTDMGVVTDPMNGDVVFDPSTNTFVYTPDENFCGSVDSFTYFISNEVGTDTATVFIDVPCEGITIYTGFSPNDDNVNDVFTILGIEEYPDNEVCVFNRWGSRVFLEKGYTNANGWRGTWNGKDLPDGTYFYVINDGEGNTYSGYVQIHR